MRSLTAVAARPAARLQDPFALRTLPQVHGLALDTLARVADVVRDGTCAWSENPAVDSPRASSSHHGAFHAAYLASALDAALLAVAGAGGLALRRIAMLLDPTPDRRRGVPRRRPAGRLRGDGPGVRRGVGAR